MSYMRVIPRDFFNEAKLLNCLGKLSIAIHDQQTKGLDLKHELEDDSLFQVRQDEDGNLLIDNYYVYLNGSELYLYIPYNCKDRKYPLYTLIDGEIYDVLDEEGNLILDPP